MQYLTWYSSNSQHNYKHSEISGLIKTEHFDHKKILKLYLGPELILKFSLNSLRRPNLSPLIYNQHSLILWMIFWYICEGHLQVMQSIFVLETSRPNGPIAQWISLFRKENAPTALKQVTEHSCFLSLNSNLQCIPDFEVISLFRSFISSPPKNNYFIAECK